jgi:hypothetical protein
VGAHDLHAASGDCAVSGSEARSRILVRPGPASADGALASSETTGRGREARFVAGMKCGRASAAAGVR